jgi:energy-coupling factor transport system ATP-binding protein
MNQARGRLRPGELAEAVVLADVSLAMTVVGQFVPFGSALMAAAVVPLAVIGARHRLRAVFVGVVAASAVGFLVVGTAAITSMFACGAFGALVGAADRRGWSRLRTTVLGLVLLWPPIALIVDALLFVFSDLRQLVLDNIRNAWRGLLHFMQSLESGLETLWHQPVILAVIAVFLAVQIAGALRQAANTADPERKRAIYTRGSGAIGSILVSLAIISVLGRSESWSDSALNWTLDYWWIVVPVGLFFAVGFGIWIAQGLSGPALRRVRAAFGTAYTESVVVDDGDEKPAPLPLQLRDVDFRYPNAPTDALHDVSLRVDAGELVAIVGSNGSGKSTLARLIAGRQIATGGTIERPGAIALGHPGGTAIVFQRPEAQVLGVRVRDDIVWGLHSLGDLDVDAVLDRVGLRELADRETSTLSGGELQRLAIAAALARAPRLLVSDESTAMVDADGRERLIALMRELAHDDDLGVVHVTHHAQEAATADRLVALARGQVIADTVPSGPALPGGEAPSPSRASGRTPGGPVITLSGVGHVYSRGTPWAKRALEHVDLEIRAGEALLIVGHNGSGKSTLAWILAGLLQPSEGKALLDREPIADHVGHVGLSFQHARLQLLRPTVLDEVRTASGVSEADARAALALVGLDPIAIAGRRVDELSGGQMRRVVLAAVLARRPEALVLDEPFAGLDAHGRRELESVLAALRRDRNVALVIVSHDHDLHDGLVDRVIELERGRIHDERFDAFMEGDPA